MTQNLWDKFTHLEESYVLAYFELECHTLNVARG